MAPSPSHDDVDDTLLAFVSVYQLSRSCSLLNFSLTLTHACSLITAMALIGSGENSVSFGEGAGKKRRWRWKRVPVSFPSCHSFTPKSL